MSAISGPAVVWLVVGLVSTVALLAVLIALVRHVMILGRALGRFQREVSPIASEIGAEAERASGRSHRVVAERPFGRPGGSEVR